ncbi:MAG: hypothetical protein A2161_19330 [Candidatus Schekmanbacteria bacterium RBG_13_48_7]|uniref:Glutathionylspermidine synthase pre-ATP-grasp-like domain-containing protein n=1 Tax=Candidatus Schekmanbacteria bacterium RBG_13_48_7 TaxID=1817878 RepID=A0A1F7RPR9_9BACT|nr:MAG: hypothetical protein A2161_19330 [Candidatus Schekmanbacteria bacterium RBG_13_48_7]
MSKQLEKFNKDFIEIVKKLDNPPGRIKDEVTGMFERMRERRCLAGDKVLPTFIKPHFVTTSQIKKYRKIVEIILNCQENLINLYFSDPAHRALYELLPPEIPLVETETGLKRNIFFSRLDAIEVDDSVKFLEFNCDSPGGAYYADIQMEELYKISVLQEFSKKYKIVPQKYRPVVLETLLSAWKDFGGKTKPCIAVVGNPKVTNVNEFILFSEYFHDKGYPSFFTDPWSLEYDGKSLTKDGKKIDLIYRRGVLSDYSQHEKEAKPVVDAYKDGNVCFANPLRAKLGDNKNLLSVLTDPKMSFLFSKKEQEILRNHLPWTRMVRDMKTDYEGNEINLLEYIRKNRDKFIIKPNSAFGGKGVVIGYEVDQSAWDATIQEATTVQKVVQEYVPIPKDVYPIFKPDLIFEEKKYNTNFFSFHGKFGGGFVRTSDSSVINISAGGALVTFMLIDDGK